MAGCGIQTLMRLLRSVLLVIIFAVQPLASVHAQPRPEKVGGKRQPCPIVQQGLIMHADDSVAECRHGESPVKLVNANSSVPHLEVVSRHHVYR